MGAEGGLKSDRVEQVRANVSKSKTSERFRDG